MLCLHTTIVQCFHFPSVFTVAPFVRHMARTSPPSPLPPPLPPPHLLPISSVRYSRLPLSCFEDNFLPCNQMSSLHDGRDGNQRGNLRGGSAGVFGLIAPMSKHTECAQPSEKRLRRTPLPNNHLELETESCFWNMYLCPGLHSPRLQTKACWSF